MALVYGDTKDNPASQTENTSTKTTSSDTGSVLDQASAESLESQLWVQGLMKRGVGDGFLSDIYNEEILTPHQEMQRIREMLAMNAFAQTAVDTVGDLLLGKTQRIVSEDERTQEFFQEEWLPASNVLDAMRITARDFIGYGNYYFEKLRGKNTGMPRKFEAVAHPERMWKQREDGELQQYILEIPRNQLPEGEDLEQFSVGYGRHRRESVYGISFSPEEVGAGTLGQGSIQYYGRSPLASVISDHKILKEIERSMAVFSRYKSVPKKLISMFDNDQMPLSNQEYQRVMDDWQTLDDFENFVVNGKQFDVEDLDYSGNQVDFKQMTDYLKRKITSVLGPEFYFHGENTTHAVSNSQQTTFYLRVQSWRDQFLDPWNQVLTEVAKRQGLSEDVHWELGPFDFETDEEKREKAIKAYNAGAITVDEARELLGMEPADDSEVGRAYKWELQDEPAAAPLQQKLEDMIEEDKEAE